MWKTILKRILIMIPEIIILSLLVFLLAQHMPGDPFTGTITPQTSQAQLHHLMAKAGLYDPWYVELLPNLSSIIIVDAILNLTANIGIEVGLTFLGFGLPSNTPSLGTLVGFAQDPSILTTKPWVWLPAALLILVLCVGISYIGNVVRRAFDARQRLG